MTDSVEEVIKNAKTVEEMFEAFKNSVGQDTALRDKISEIAHEMEYYTLKIISVLQKTHSFKDSSDVYMNEVQDILNGEVQDYLKKLANLISSVSYYKYHDSFRFVIQQLCFVITYAHFLQHETLLSRNEVAEVLKLEIDQSVGFHLDVEDYLFGILKLASELSRFSINAVVAGNVNLPFKIAEFLSDLDAKFRLLNLKNDALRRRYDALKYDVQKAEQVVYDLTIRGLKPEK